MLNQAEKSLRRKLIIPLRVDGSVDRMQIDKIYVLAKIVDRGGSLNLIFIGIDEQTERGATGLLKALVSAVKSSMSSEEEKIFWMKLSSICTDGAVFTLAIKIG